MSVIKRLSEAYKISRGPIVFREDIMTPAEFKIIKEEGLLEGLNFDGSLYTLQKTMFNDKIFEIEENMLKVDAIIDVSTTIKPTTKTENKTFTGVDTPVKSKKDVTDGKNVTDNV